MVQDNAEITPLSHVDASGNMEPPLTPKILLTGGNNRAKCREGREGERERERERGGHF